MQPAARWIAALALASSVAGCGTPSPIVTQPVASPVVAAGATRGDPARSTAPATSAAPAASLVLEGTGAIGCQPPFGGEAWADLRQVDDPAATLADDWQPDGGSHFDLALTDEQRCAFRVGRAVDASATVAPGRYIVLGAVNILSDLASTPPGGGPPVPPRMGTEFRCQAPLTVGPDTAEVHVLIRYAIDRPCLVSVHTVDRG